MKKEVSFGLGPREVQSPLMSSGKPRRIASTVLSLIFTLIVIGGALFTYFNGQWVLDEIHYYSYHPNSEMQSFVSLTTMTPEGKFLFYASRPTLDNATDFTAACGSSSPQTAILGCYTRQRIYLYDVTDTRLTGIKPVTAAYEMLHAAYARMTSSDRTHLNSLIEAEYTTLSSNRSISDKVTYFAKTEPGQRDNELFSIIATEVPSIPPQLESYYNRYFSNRQALVNMYNQYSGVFTSINNQAEQLSNQLTALTNTINAEEVSYEASIARLNNEIDAYNQAVSDGSYSSQSEADTARQKLTTEVNTLSNQRDSINQQINQYNDLRTQLQALDAEATALNESINSSLTPTPSI